MGEKTSPLVGSVPTSGLVSTSDQIFERKPDAIQIRTEPHFKQFADQVFDSPERLKELRTGMETDRTYWDDEARPLREKRNELDQRIAGLQQLMANHYVSRATDSFLTKISNAFFSALTALPRAIMNYFRGKEVVDLTAQRERIHQEYQLASDESWRLRDEIMNVKHRLDVCEPSTEEKKKTIFKQLAHDLKRNPTIYNGKVLNEEAWKELKTSVVLTPEEMTFLEQNPFYSEAKEKYHFKDSSELSPEEASYNTLFEKLQSKLQEYLEKTVIPRIFDELNGTYSKEEALKIIRYLKQEFPMYLIQEITRESGGKLAAKLTNDNEWNLELRHQDNVTVARAYVPLIITNSRTAISIGKEEVHTLIVDFAKQEYWHKIESFHSA